MDLRKHKLLGKIYHRCQELIDKAGASKEAFILANDIALMIHYHEQIPNGYNLEHLVTLNVTEEQFKLIQEQHYVVFPDDTEIYSMNGYDWFKVKVINPDTKKQYTEADLNRAYQNGYSLCLEMGGQKRK